MTSKYGDGLRPTAAQSVQIVWRGAAELIIGVQRRPGLSLEISIHGGLKSSGSGDQKGAPEETPASCPTPSGRYSAEFHEF